MTTQIQYQSGQLVQTGDYFNYEVIKDKGNSVIVTPAYGSPVQWGEREGENYEYNKNSLYPVTP